MALHRVLIIEDDVLTAAILADELRERGWDVEVRHSAAEGYAAALTLRPDVLLVDVVLPEMDGAALCAALRLAPGLRMPVVLCSSRDVSEELSRSVGADLFLAKPLNPSVVHTALARLVEASAAPPPLLPLTQAIRLPPGEVVGVAAVPGGSGGEPGGHGVEEGELRPGWLPPLLQRLHDRKFTGVLEVDAGDWRAKIFLQSGDPASARSSDRETELGRVLQRLGLGHAAGIEASAEQARRSGRALGEQLVAAALLDRAAAERALREQIVLRVELASTQSSGRYSLTPAEPVGLAGFEVPAGVVFWRIGGEPPVSIHPGDASRYVRVEAPPWIWPIVDPGGRLIEGKAALFGGARLSECERVGGEAMTRLVATFRRFGLLRLTDDAPSVPLRDDGPSRSEIEALEARITAQHRVLADADHYTVLGLRPDALGLEVQAAALTAIAAIHPDTLPPGVRPATRERAQQLFARILDAGRVLGDGERRPIYDALLAAHGGFRFDPIGMENQAVLQADRARAAFRRGEYATAAALFRAAVALDTGDADIVAMLGRARRLACPADPDAGLPELRRALTLDPDAEYALYWMALVHEERGESDQARTLLRRALQHNQEFELAREALRAMSP